MSDVRTLLRAEDYEGLARCLCERFGVSVDPEALGRSCRRLLLSGIDPTLASGASEATCYMWLKMRLMELGAFVVGGPDHTSEPRLTVAMHMFFVHLAETDEMLARLRNESPDRAADNTARSKVFTTPEVIKPIDRVSARVAPPPPTVCEENGKESA